MTVCIYGEFYDVGIKFFENMEILKVKEYTSSVFIEYKKSKNKKVTFSMNIKDYRQVQRHIKINSLGI